MAYGNECMFEKQELTWCIAYSVLTADNGPLDIKGSFTYWSITAYGMSGSSGL